MRGRNFYYIFYYVVPTFHIPVRPAAGHCFLYGPVRVLRLAWPVVNVPYRHGFSSYRRGRSEVGEWYGATKEKLARGPSPSSPPSPADRRGSVFISLASTAVVRGHNVTKK
jgi:hypothetical protein